MPIIYLRLYQIKLFYVVLILGIFALGCTNNYKLNQAQKIDPKNYNDIENGIVFGKENSSTKIIIFGNYECKFCRKFLIKELNTLLNYENGDIKVVLKLIPFSSYKEENEALKMAYAVYKFGNYIPYHNLLLKEDKIYFSSDFEDYLFQIMQLNGSIAEYFYSDEPQKLLNDEIKLFNDLGLKGTPAYIINNMLYAGYLTADEIKYHIENNK